ncbi:glutamine--fructose-6-phosphate transaminase (isomerizing), partial [Candidatus Woesearchaeota archaeon CG08_land_8_20_14_0_20_43_7]
MCGIIAYRGDGEKDANEVVLKGLKSLEYRGYDSWGVASRKDQKIKQIKNIGKIGHIELEQLGLAKSKTSIGHTRWATHGSVHKRNAHPHASSCGSVSVVHNGIIENFQELRAMLSEEGIEFSTDTDTEVIPHNIMHLMKGGDSFEEAFRKTLLSLRGSFAVVAIHSDHDVLLGARNGSPLVLGIGDNDHFLASDVPAFLEHTSKVTYLDDDDMVVISDSGHKVISLLDGKESIRDIHTVTWDVEQAKKGKYDHFMTKEIDEQKTTIKNAIEQDSELIDKCIEALNDANGVFFVGCGTSYHACVSASYQFSHIAKEHVNVVLASEFRNYEEFLNEKTLMVAVSQSGETADLLDAVKTAKRKGVKIMCIVNVMGSTLMRISDIAVLMNAGPEICVLSTKSYTSQLSILTLLAYGLADRLDEGRRLIMKVSDSVGSIIKKSEPIVSALAERFKTSSNMFLIGRDLAYPSALEGALKIKEVSYIHAEGFAGGELKHGTIALIEENVPVIVLSTDSTRELIVSNAMEIRSRGGYIIGIDSVPNPVFDTFIKIDSFGNADPIAMIIPIQLLSYHLAIQRGCDP